MNVLTWKDPSDGKITHEVTPVGRGTVRTFYQFAASGRPDIITLPAAAIKVDGEHRKIAKVVEIIESKLKL